MSRYEVDLTDAIAALRKWQKEHGSQFTEFAMLIEAIDVQVKAIEDVKFPGNTANFNPDQRCSGCLTHAGPLDSNNECKWCAEDRRRDLRGEP